jgi:hypothetical protein
LPALFDGSFAACRALNALDQTHVTQHVTAVPDASRTGGAFVGIAWHMPQGVFITIENIGGEVGADVCTAEVVISVSARVGQCMRRCRRRPRPARSNTVRATAANPWSRRLVVMTRACLPTGFELVEQILRMLRR